MSGWRNDKFQRRRNADKKYLGAYVVGQGFRCHWCGASIVTHRLLRRWGAEIVWTTHDAVRCVIGGRSCVYLFASIDHIVPLRRAGHAPNIRNIVAACVPCNRLRGDMDIVTFRRFRDAQQRASPR